VNANYKKAFTERSKFATGKKIRPKPFFTKGHDLKIENSQKVLPRNVNNLNFTFVQPFRN
jgi:hypothetical protein